jgi:hypothetical protein
VDQFAGGLLAFGLVAGGLLFAYGQAMIAWPDLFERIGAVSLGKLSPRAPFRWSGAGMIVSGGTILLSGMLARWHLGAAFLFAVYFIVFGTCQFFARPAPATGPPPSQGAPPPTPE